MAVVEGKVWIGEEGEVQGLDAAAEVVGGGSGESGEELGAAEAGLDVGGGGGEDGAVTG